MKCIITLTGPTASGKSTLAQDLVSQSKTISEVISTTTRPIRRGEKMGVHYNFISHSEFAKRDKNGEFLETSSVGNNWYGVEKQAVRSILKKNHTCLVVCDPAGAKSIFDYGKEKGVPVCNVFIDIDKEEIFKRITYRLESETESDLSHEAIKRKVSSAAERAVLYSSSERLWGSVLQYDLKINRLSSLKDSESAKASLLGAIEQLRLYGTSSYFDYPLEKNLVCTQRYSDQEVEDMTEHLSDVLYNKIISGQTPEIDIETVNQVTLNYDKNNYMVI